MHIDGTDRFWHRPWEGCRTTTTYVKEPTIDPDFDLGEWIGQRAAVVNGQIYTVADCLRLTTPDLRSHLSLYCVNDDGDHAGDFIISMEPDGRTVKSITWVPHEPEFDTSAVMTFLEMIPLREA